MRRPSMDSPPPSQPAGHLRSRIFHKYLENRIADINKNLPRAHSVKKLAILPGEPSIPSR